MESKYIQLSETILNAKKENDKNIQLVESIELKIPNDIHEDFILYRTNILFYTSFVKTNLKLIDNTLRTFISLCDKNNGNEKTLDSIYSEFHKFNNDNSFDKKYKDMVLSCDEMLDLMQSIQSNIKNTID